MIVLHQKMVPPQGIQRLKVKKNSARVAVGPDIYRYLNLINNIMMRLFLALQLYNKLQCYVTSTYQYIHTVDYTTHDGGTIIFDCKNTYNIISCV